MEFKDYYELMGVARDATQDEIKRAYRKLARKYHPDVSKEADAEERFKSLGEAYEVLKDPEKRAAYDQLGANWQGGQDFNAPPDWDAGFEFTGGGYTGGDSADYSDFFESLFGQARAAQGGGRPGGFPRAAARARIGIDRHFFSHRNRIGLDVSAQFMGEHFDDLTAPIGGIVSSFTTLDARVWLAIRDAELFAAVDNALDTERMEVLGTWRRFRQYRFGLTWNFYN